MAPKTALKIDYALLGLVPIGEANAITARLLWEVHRIGAVPTVKYKLNMMVIEALVQRKKTRQGASEVTLYWKQSG